MILFGKIQKFHNKAQSVERHYIVYFQSYCYLLVGLFNMVWQLLKQKLLKIIKLNY